MAKKTATLWHRLACGCHRQDHKARWCGWSRLILPMMSALALAWFLCRVIPKPIRATYPCQRAAFPLASTLIIWLLGVKSGLLMWLNFTARVRKLRPALTLGGVACLLALTAVAANEVVKYVSTLSASPSAWAPSDPPNSPMGTARGIFPGRVAWMRDTNATRWNGTSGHWWDDTTGVNQTAVDRMASRTLRTLTGATSDSEAWDEIFRYYNSTHGRGDVGYQAGEKIVIKINCNNTSGYADTDNNADATPQSVLAILRQLVTYAGVAQSNITVYEAPNTPPSRVIPDRTYSRCYAQFPNVVYADCTGTNGRTLIQWVTNAITYSVGNGCGRNLASCVYQATYLINMSLFKGHNTAGVTLTAKNHYGSINTREHTFIRASTSGMGAYSPFVDLIGHQHLGQKTILFMIDGLYGVRDVNDTVGTQYGAWNNLFGGQWSASYFMSLDPVAIDSVGVDFLRAEFGDNLGAGKSANCDNYLHEAANANTSTNNYFQNGQRLPSLGVHEHWNNPTRKQYSRNLGTSNGIELMAVHTLAGLSVALTTPTNNAVFAAGSPIVLTAAVTTNWSTVGRVDFYRGATWLGSLTNTPFSLDWNNAPPGAWAISAVATDSEGLCATSAVVSVSVQAETNLPPLILAQPTNQVVMAGDTAWFSTEVGGWPAPAYQWCKDNTDLPGANGAILALPDATPDQSGNYRVVATNVAGAVTSLVAGLAVLLPPTNISLIPTGALWRYHDKAQDLGASWRSNVFSDLTWSNGYAELGFGDTKDGRPERTMIASNGQWTTYFRHTFTASNVTTLTNLQCRLLRDDGAVVYLNGAEIFRNNMTNTAIAYNTPALRACSDDGTVYYTTNVPLHLLRSGSNLLAVEVHQDALTSTDVSFNFELCGQRIVQPPVFFTHPASQTRLEGTPATFMAEAASATPFTYRWLSNDVHLAGATGTTLSFTSVTTNLAATYSLLASNAAGATTSAPAALLVMPFPWLTACAYGSSDRFEFQFTGGLACRVEVSANLADWAVLTNVPAGAGTIRIIDLTEGQPSRFYRVLVVP